MRKKRSKVLILYLGGTFGMDADPLTIPRLNPQRLRRRLVDRVPELERLADCQVQIQMNRDSAHLDPVDWANLAKVISEQWDRFDGIVVLHGTDTLAYTASALSFLLRPCKKPVILTGAQRPLAAIRSDARRNLISAVELAARGAAEQAPQVSVFFNDLLFQGNRVRKRSAVDFAGFESPKAPVLARVGASIHVLASGSAGASRSIKSKLKRPKPAPRLRPCFSSRVLMVHLTPGFPAEALMPLLSDLDGLLLVAFPSGTAPTHQEAFRKLLSAARARGLPVMVVTEGAGVTGNEYQAGKALLDEGCLWSGTMTPECAYVKASWLLGQPRGAEILKAWWNVEFADEGVSQGR